MATKIFGVTPNQPLGSPAATPGSFLFYDGYQELSNLRIGIYGSSSATPNLLEDNAIFVDIGDTILFVDYRSRASFSNDFLDAVPDANSVTRIYNVLLNREPDTGGLASYTNTTNYATNNSVIDSIRFSTEYRPNKSSLFEYPILIYNQNGNLVWQSNHYESYIDYYGGPEGLLNYYSNSNNFWDYDFDQTNEPVQSKSKEEFGQDHYQNHGRGEGRSFNNYIIPNEPYIIIKTENLTPTFNMMRIKDSVNWFRSSGVISAKDIIDYINEHTNHDIQQENVSINNLFSIMSTEQFSPQIGKNLSPPNQFSELYNMYSQLNYTPTITLNGSTSIKILVNNYNNS